MAQRQDPTSSKPKPDVPFFRGHADPAHRLDHDHVLVHLERELSRLDNQAARGETRAFGRNSDMIFEKLDSLREQQVSLALSHMALDKILEPDTHPKDDEATAEEAYAKDAAALQHKVLDLSSLSDRLLSLTNTMADFQNLSSDLARHRWEEADEGEGSEPLHSRETPQRRERRRWGPRSEISHNDTAGGDTFIPVKSSRDNTPPPR